MSPARSGKTSLQKSRDIQAISHNTLQGLSYIAIPPSSLENSTSVEQNLATLSIPVTTEGVYIHYDITISPDLTRFSPQNSPGFGKK